MAEPVPGVAKPVPGVAEPVPGVAEPVPGGAEPVPGGAEALTGGCLCGAVRFEATLPFIRTSICHCSMCRRAAGAPYMAFLTLPRAQFRLTAGAPATYRSSDRAARGFCARCGTALLYDEQGADFIDVASATLDQPDQAPPQDQIFAADALAWVDGVPALPSYPRERTG